MANDMAQSICLHTSVVATAKAAMPTSGLFPQTIRGIPFSNNILTFLLLVASTGACEPERSTATSSLEHGAILSHQPRRSFLSFLAVASRQGSTGRDQYAQHTTRL